jgi:uncharacterized protein with HEPN domain
MLDAVRLARQFVQGKSGADYDDDQPLRLALVHLLQTIGEAARRVSSEFRTRHPEIPWPAVVGMRHRVVHDYLSVDLDLVWDVVQGDLPQLIAALEPLATS